MMKRGLRGMTAPALALVVGGCNLVLGFQPATLDAVAVGSGDATRMDRRSPMDLSILSSLVSNFHESSGLCHRIRLAYIVLGLRARIL